ncbi:hypothetical protein IW262DRAFT_1485821 [Armillaria fumosa]|nr:hypothetical protein IW262DRAFT_1485821 [Armillaria fumosa]
MTFSCYLCLAGNIVCDELVLNPLRISFNSTTSSREQEMYYQESNSLSVASLFEHSGVRAPFCIVADHREYSVYEHGGRQGSELRRRAQGLLYQRRKSNKVWEFRARYLHQSPATSILIGLILPGLAEGRAQPKRRERRIPTLYILGGIPSSFRCFSAPGSLRFSAGRGTTIERTTPKTVKRQDKSRRNPIEQKLVMVGGKMILHSHLAYSYSNFLTKSLSSFAAIHNCGV